MTEQQHSEITDKDRQAVKRLREYFRKNPPLVWKYGANDKEFTQWVEDVLEVIRADEMAQARQAFEKVRKTRSDK